MVELNITLELIKQLTFSSIVLSFVYFIGILTCLGVMIVMWFIPGLKQKIRDLKLVRNFRTSVPMVNITCNQADCKYKDDKGRCFKDDMNGIIINSQGECGSWEEKKIEIMD